MTLVGNVQGSVPKPQQSLSTVQPIPRATDLDSALKAIQALSNNLNVAQQAAAAAAALAQSLGNAAAQASATTAAADSGGDYREMRNLRTTQTVRVFNPADNTQYVDVTQITSLTFSNAKGQKLVWTL